MLIYCQSSHYTDIVCVCVCVFIDLPYIRCTSSGSTESRLLTRSLANASLQHSPLYVHEETANNGISLEHTLNSNTIHAALSDGFAATDRSWFKHNGWLLHQHGILLRKCNDLCINLKVCKVQFSCIKVWKMLFSCTNLKVGKIMFLCTNLKVCKNVILVIIMHVNCVFVH